MRVKRLLPFLLFLVPSIVKADTQSFGGQWRGMNNADASIMISDNEAQDLSNVDITDNGSGIRKRDGYSQFKTIGTSTWGVRGGYYFRDTSGNNYIVHANNQSLFKSLNSGAYSAFLTTDTAGSYYDFTDSQGYLYRATSNRDQLCRYDGTTLTYYPSAPQGDQIEALPDRLAISGASAYPNRVYFSGAADFTNFTTGLNDTDPFYEEFGLPGQKLTAIKYALGRLFAWTGTTLSFWSGITQFDGTIQDVTTNVGTSQPGSILYDNSIIYWQGDDKHFYSFDGNSIEKISKPISGSVSGFVGGESKVAIQTTQADFSLGTASSSLTLSENPGFINYISTGETLDNFSDNECASNPAWTTTTSGGASVSCSGGAMYFDTTPLVSYGIATLQLQNPQNTLKKIDFDALMTGANEYFSVSLCTGTPSGSSLAPSSGGCYSFAYFKNNTGTDTETIYKDGTSLYSTSIEGNYVPSALGRCIFKISNSGLIEYSRDGLITISTTDTTFTEPITYIRFFAASFIFSPSGTVSVDNINLYSSNGTFISSPFNIGSAVTAWGSFSDNSTKTGNASLAYTIYTDTNTSIDTTNATTFVSSQTITPPAIPTLATAPYLVWKATFTRTDSTETISLDSVSIAWNEGTVTHTFGSIDKNHRLYWSLAENNSTTNNATYIYDPRFASWLKYSVPMDAVTKVGDSFYFGGPSTGVVYLYPSGTNDDGSAITAYWKSKDFIGGDPFVEKDFQNYSMIARTQTGSNVDLDISYNGSPSYTRNNISLTSSLGLPFIRYNARFPTGKIGSFVNFKFGNDDLSSPFEVYSMKYDYTPRAWRVMQ